MPFPKGVKKAVAVFDRADMIITYTERILGVLGIIEDDNAVIRGKLDQLLARREFSPVPALGWTTLSGALTDLWQQITNTHGSVNSYGGTMVTYLSQIAPDADAARAAAEGTLGRVMRSLAGYGEGLPVVTIPLADSGSYGLQPNCCAVTVSLADIPPGLGHTFGNPPSYEGLGYLSWQYKGRNGPDRVIAYAESSWFVLGPMDAVTIHLAPGVTGELIQWTVG